MKEVQDLIFNKEMKKLKLINETFWRTQECLSDSRQPNAAFNNHQNYTDYYRELDLNRAIATTRYTVNGITYTRELFSFCR